MFRRVALSVVAVILVLAGYAIYRAMPTAEKTVRAYFDALAARQPIRAHDHLDEVESVVPPEHWSSLWSVLIDERYKPPQNVRVGGWQHADVDGQRVVAVQYEMDGTTYSSLFKLRKFDTVWRITNGVGTVAVNYAGAAVNGHRLGAGKTLKLFPGVYELGAAPRAPLVSASPVRVVVTPDKAGTADLRTVLTETGRELVRDKVESVLLECERNGGAAGMTGCPFKYTGSVTAKLKWTILNRPELVIEEVEPGVVTVRGVGPGSVGLTITEGGAAPIERVDSFPVDGKCVEIDDRVSCTFTA